MPPKGSKKATKKDKNAAQGGARTDEEKVARKANSEHENALNRLRQAMKRERPELWKDYKHAGWEQKKRWKEIWETTGSFDSIQER